MADSRDITGKNRKFTGTTGIKLPTGTEAQRVDEAGQIRFNTDTNLAEYYDGTDWKPIDAPPTITGFTLDGGSSVTTAEIDEDAAGDATIVIQGSNFDATSGTVIFEPEGGGANVSTQTITRTSSSSFTVTVTRGDFVQANGPYAIKLTNGSGLAATLSSALTVANEPPAFATAADTNIGTVQNGQSSTEFDANLTTVVATDPDGDSVTHTISAGTLPNGMSLETDGTFTGTTSSLPSSLTNYTFTVQAATALSTVTRQFVVSAIDSLNIAASGGTETTSGDYKIHTFTSGGTFTVSKAGIAPEPSVVDYLVIAGGGGGGGPPDPTHGGGGGGAGGYRESHSDPVSGPYTASPLATPTGITVTATSYPITVGGGGGGGNPASPGNSSSFSTITSAGGGKGNVAFNGGIPGGSGGGGGVDPGATRGNGNVPPVSPPQGQPSGIGPAGWAGGAGGGGAGAAGTDGLSSGGSGGSFGGRGGNGVTTSITGSPVQRAGGGGAASRSDVPFGPGVPGSGSPGTGGAGGGGSAPNQSGGTNTGGGAGGGRPGGGGTGGSGLVVIRYKYQ